MAHVRTVHKMPLGARAILLLHRGQGVRRMPYSTLRLKNSDGIPFGGRATRLILASVNGGSTVALYCRLRRPGGMSLYRPGTLRKGIANGPKSMCLAIPSWGRV